MGVIHSDPQEEVAIYIIESDDIFVRLSMDSFFHY